MDSGGTTGWYEDRYLLCICQELKASFFSPAGKMGDWTVQRPVCMPRRRMGAAPENSSHASLRWLGKIEGREAMSFWVSRKT